MTKSKETIEAEADAAARELVEMFSDPNLPSPRYRYWTFDPERQEFVRNPWDAFFDQLIDELYGQAEDADHATPKAAPSDKP